MNKRIRKKRDRQQLAGTIRELVALTEFEEARRQAQLRRFIRDCERLYEKNKAQSHKGGGYLSRT